jgi:hypothetical protein
LAYIDILFTPKLYLEEEFPGLTIYWRTLGIGGLELSLRIAGPIFDERSNVKKRSADMSIVFSS